MLGPSISHPVKIMKPASEKRTRAWAETRFSNFQLANSGYIKYTVAWENPPYPALASYPGKTEGRRPADVILRTEI